MADPARRVGVHDAKTQLSRLLREVEEGNEIVVMRGGKPIARIVGEPQGRAVADTFGMFKGQFELGEDFDVESEELADLFGVPRIEKATSRPDRSRSTSQRRRAADGA